MKLSLFVILVACTLSAMTAVPRLRRAIDPEEESETQNTTPDAVPTTCARTTPCAWSFYTNPVTKFITLTINNTYCTCSPESTCTMYEDDETAGSYMWRCKVSES